MMEPINSKLLKILTLVMIKINMAKEWQDIYQIIVRRNTYLEFDYYILY